MPDRATPTPFYRAMSTLDDTSYILSENLQILRVNPGWTKFAEANGGHDMLTRWGRGSFVLDAISGELREVYRALLVTTLASNTRIAHDYLLDTHPYRMLVIPVARRFLVVTHAEQLDAAKVSQGVYHRDGVVTVCSDCTRVKAVGEGEHWNLIPGHEALFGTAISHGLCPLCATHALQAFR